jgi:tetratricopeptide (TPR) repeat protein
MMGEMGMRRRLFWTIGSVLPIMILASSCKNPNLSGGILHFDQKRYERARETLLKAIAQEPNNYEAYYMLGKTYAELDSTEQSIRAFDKAVETSGPKREIVEADVINARDHYWSARHNEGLALAKAGQDNKLADKEADARNDFRAALNKFKRARVYNSQREETPRNMGVMYFNLGQVDSGLVTLKEAASLAKPGDTKAAQFLFTQYRELGDKAVEKGGLSTDKAATIQNLKDAIKFYREAEPLKAGECDLLFSMGVVFYQLAEAEESARDTHFAEAVDYFEKTLQCNPSDQEALYNAATLYLELKRCERGIEHARTLLDLDPKKGKHYNIVGRLNDCLGKKNERIGGLVFAKALDQGEVVPDLKPELEKLGTSDAMKKYREEGKPDEVRTFQDTSGGAYMCWFYWGRGKAIAFLNGEYKYEQSFKPIQEGTAPGQK